MTESNELYARYNVDDVSDIVSVYDIIGKKYGFLERGGLINYDRVTDLVINDVKPDNLAN
mgnify:CR=1 FL=1